MSPVITSSLPFPPPSKIVIMFPCFTPFWRALI
jgi:hypothetical protein